MRPQRALLGLLAAAAIVPAAVSLRPAPMAATGGCDMGRTANPGAEEMAALDQINAFRAGHGLDPLMLSATLSRAATEKAASMAAGAPFGHDDPHRSWQQRLADCGYDINTYVSENIAAGTETAAQTVQMWQDSAGHRENMLFPSARSAGIARVRGSAPYGWYWTANFGSADSD
jgi:uncharacterized protein YkwD